MVTSLMPTDKSIENISEMPRTDIKIRPRQAVAKLSAYVPPLEGRRQSLRLDFNENTTPLPGSASVQQMLCEEFSIYPEYDVFIDRLSTLFEVPADSIMITNGSDEGLCVIASTFIEPKLDKALIVTPTFALIPHSLHLAESQLIEIPYTSDWQYDISAIENALKQGIKLVVFATPDNPVGAILPLDVLTRWLVAFPETLFVMDEAYSEYAGQSALPLVQQYSNLLVTRTFSKAWGLAGLRLGMIFGAPYLLNEIKKVRSPYSVNVAAIAAAVGLFDLYPQILNNAKETMARKQKIVEVLKARGYLVVPGHGNFFMMGLGLAAQQFCQFMKSQGILVRDRSSMHEMLQGYVRVSVGTEAEMQAFLSALDNFSKTHTLLFDVDGTLVDTTKSFDAVIEQLIDRHSNQSLKTDELKLLREEGGYNDDWDATVELLKRRGVTVSFEQIAKEGCELYLSIAKKVETWLLDSEKLALLAKRFRMGVVTGRTREEFESIWQERMSPYFECMICQDDIAGAAKKPAPDLLLGAMQKMNVQNGFYIGNSVDDIQAAIAAELKPVAVLTTLDSDCLQEAGASTLLTTPDDIFKAMQVI